MRRVSGLLIVALLATSACRSVVREHSKGPAPLDPPAEGAELIDYRGAMHVHTDLSHDSGGTLAELAEAAAAVGIEFVVITDHSQRHVDAPDSLMGVTFIVGVEYSTDRGHLVVVGDPELRSDDRKDSLKVSSFAEAAGGFTIVAHPFWRNDDWRWADHEDRVTHLEVANIASDLAEDVCGALLRIPPYLFNRTGTLATLLDRPEREIAVWDRLLAERRVIAVGACDAHDRWYAGYEDVLPLLTTHTLAESASAPDLLAAIQSGRCYLAWEVFGTSDGFRFCAEGAEGRTEMGAEVPWNEGMMLRVHVPADAHIEVRRDGALHASAVARRWQLPVTQPGVYRVEVYRDERLWILSNPIFIR